ncbi:pyruvoyl-dependent arginine decarboxylase [Rhodococcus sp. X156]|uniref:pyruvoyl-dependent arginine decarboxylase n=1 Tax=Rhodococcus sp. X156 TaxID=2499145 RepID=UPI001F494E57|nr:pyruvoyl-dependent arginine decarboxylase [Rhodococcus sp. X156]
MTRSMDRTGHHRYADDVETSPAQPNRRDTAMAIQIATGVGTASTPLAAFDAALCEMGVGDYNLIRLSSVIPSGASVRHVDQVDQRARHGDGLYCVYAEEHATVPGASAAAGIGWVVKSDGSGSGLFVEHEGSSEREVATQIRASLKDMTAYRGGGYDAPQMCIETAVCVDKPVCVMVMAAYTGMWWDIR